MPSRREINRQLERDADRVYAQLDRLCPVDEGDLKRSIRVRVRQGKINIEMLFYGWILNVTNNIRRGWIDNALAPFQDLPLSYGSRGGNPRFRGELAKRTLRPEPGGRRRGRGNQAGFGGRRRESRPDDSNLGPVRRRR